MISIDTSLVRKLVVAQFPEWANLPIKPVESDGWDNRTFHLGTNMKVRLPSAEVYAPQAEKEYAWLPKLAPQLSIKIPVPVAMGTPGEGYPWNWSIYEWLDSETASIEHIADLRSFAISLAGFLKELHQCDTNGGPMAGQHNFYRGGNLTIYDTETRQAIKTLSREIDASAATVVWDTALASTWKNPPAWVHGDMAVSNLLIKNGRLSAVIDFGSMAIGDPACDLAIAWTFFTGKSRKAFRAALPLDDATWSRARGWALWKALITLAQHINTDPIKARESHRIIDEVLVGH